MRVVLLLCHAAAALFPGRQPDEGDVRHIYPLSSIGVRQNIIPTKQIKIQIGFYEHAHMLPYVLGLLENIDYPKHRLHLEFHLLGKEDTTRDQVLWYNI